MRREVRAVVIGATGRGGFGHGIDVAAKGLEGVALVAVADADPKGLADAGARLGIGPERRYRDYREMLDRERPDLVCVGPRWLDQRAAMVTAAAGTGARIFCEKPAAPNLTDLDAIRRSCAEGKAPIAFAHQMAAMPPVRKTLEDVRAGKFGPLIRMTARGKEDHRGGGEDMIVLGCHLFHLMVLFAGPPRWVSGEVRVGDRRAVRSDARAGTEPVGPLAGDQVFAAFGFEKGVIGSFVSRAGVMRPGRVPYGLVLEYAEATIDIREGEVWIYPSSVVLPSRDDLKWSKVWVESWHFTPDHKPRPMNDAIPRGNQILVRRLLDAQDGQPPWNNLDEVGWTIEMIQGVYASHLAGGARLDLPLAERRHPLES